MDLPTISPRRPIKPNHSYAGIDLWSLSKVIKAGINLILGKGNENAANTDTLLKVNLLKAQN